MAKINVEVPAVNVKYNGEEYRKVDRKAQAGDIVRITETYGDDPIEEVTVGGFYVVNRLDFVGDAQITDDDGEEYDTVGDTLEVYEKVAAALPQAPDANVKVGDRIRIISAWGTEGKYKNGDEFTVRSVEPGDRVYVNEHARIIHPSEYEVIAPADDIITHEGVQYRKVTRKANVGELVEVFEHPRSEQNGIQTVRGAESDGHIYYAKGGRRPYGYYVLEPLASPKPPRLKVGEYAKVIDDTSTITGVKRSETYVSEIRRIVEDDNSGIPFKAEKLDGSDYGWFRENTSVRATDEEVAAAKAALAKAEAERKETAKWAAIRRKVNEFKAGDIVDCVGEAKGRTGFGEVLAEIEPQKKYRVKYPTRYGICTEPVDIITLVTPVEQRFDKVAE